MNKEGEEVEVESKFIDTDHDGLDDRLNSLSIREDETIKDVLHRLDLLQLRTLPEQTLQKMIDDIEKKQQDLLDQARSFERHVHQQIVSGHYDALKKMRKQIRYLHKKFEDLEEERGHLNHVMQEQRLNKNMEDSIGGWCQIIEKFIFCLIICVLGLLFYDFSVVRPPDHILNSWNIFYIDFVCCLFFLGEFFFRLSKADDKWWFWKNNWIDFVTSIPIPPADTSRFIRLGRAARLLRFLRLLRVLRLVRAMYFIWRGMEKLKDLFDVRMMKKSLRWALFVIFLGAILIMKIEGEQEGVQHGVENFTLSLWWSFTTVVTGGFGDIYNPSTGLGQLITGGLVITGMILIGVFTATLTSLYIGEETDEINKISEDISSTIQEFKSEMTSRFDEQEKQLDSIKIIQRSEKENK
jgi:voltage-gated potassium channel